MALCSQAFNKSIKRSCASIDPSLDGSSHKKRICLDQYRLSLGLGSGLSKNIDLSSSDDDENSEDEQLCYKMDQIKAKRRASSRISFSLNPKLELSKYISQYSDDEDIKMENDMNPQQSKEEGEFKLIQVPKADKILRSKCFEYLVGAIDEAWARYCDATSCIEDEVFYNEENKNQNVSLANINRVNFGVTHNDDDANERLKSLKDSDYEYDDEDIDDDKSEIIDNYSVNSTDLTDISDHYVHQSKLLTNYRNHSLTIKKSNSNQSTNQYQKLKDRLTKAKYYLQDLVDSDDYHDIQSFWNRWDMIKYATIELVEDDDDDEVIESTIDDLETGRYFVN